MIDTNKIMLTASAMVLSISAQAFTVKGVVIDHSTKEPLIGATVQVGGTTTGVITDIDGRFEIRDIKVNRVRLSYSMFRTRRRNWSYSRDRRRNWSLLCRPTTSSSMR